MELGKLFYRIALEGMGEFNEDVRGAEDQVGGSSSKIGAAFEKIGGAALAVGKVIVKGLAVGAAGIGVLTKGALDAYSDYEQLVGGVETLFKSSSDKVIQYANNAYKTAGLSANEYMETVTSFSASLLQGLGGDTEAAAKVADQAITDMSDNANKMGTDIGMIQNAYQGFAKQNYTMLDNLKLGYGGTASEMARLINDSGVLGDTVTVTAETVNSVSFDKIIEAIHVTQDEMGITGTTAKEASTTIQGSVASMKSAWQNLLVGLADDTQDFGQLMNNFVESGVTVVGNIMPRIKIIFDAIPKLIEGLAPQIPEIVGGLLPGLIAGAISLMDGLIGVLPDIIQMLVDMLPMFVNGMMQIVSGILENLDNIILPLLVALPNVILLLVDKLLLMMPVLIEGVASLVLGIVQALPEMITSILEYIPQIITNIVNILIEGVPILLEAAIQLLNTLVDAIPVIITFLVENLPLIIDTLVTGLIGALPQLLDASIQLLMAIIDAIPVIVTELIPRIPDIVFAIVDTLIAHLPEVLDGAVQLMMAIIDAIPQIVTEVFEAAPQIVQGLIDGLMSGAERLGSAVLDLGGTILNGIKDFFGIHSPSTVMMEQADYLVQGMLEGLVTLPEQALLIFDDMRNQLTLLLGAMLEQISAYITTSFNGISTTINKVMNSIKTLITNTWNTIKTTTTTVLNAVKTTITMVLTATKKIVETDLTVAKTTVTTIFTNIYDTIKEKIENAAKIVKDTIERIKGFFKFEWSLPHLKLPHVWISGGFSLQPPSVPSFGVDWYAKGGIMTDPTVFGYNPKTGNLQVGGEAGDEAVAPIDVLLDYIRTAVGEQNAGLLEAIDRLIEMLAEYLPLLLSKDSQLVLDTGVLVGHTAHAMNEELGDIYDRNGRGG